MKEGVKIVLIGGTGRCGTNVLKEILSRHDRVAVLPFEHRFTIDPRGVVDFYHSLKYSWSPFVCDEKFKEMIRFLRSLRKRGRFRYFIGSMIRRVDREGRFLSSPSYHRWEMDRWFPNYTSHLERLIDDLAMFRYRSSWPGTRGLRVRNRMAFVTSDAQAVRRILRAFLENLIDDLLESRDCDVFVEDNTWNLLYAEPILEILPDAKFIHMVRDPRDVVASLMTQRWTPNRLEDVIVYYSHLMDRIGRTTNELGGKRLLTVALEALVSDPKKEITGICRFCGLEVQDGLSEIDLGKSHSGRWKTEFTEEEKETLGDALKAHLKRYDYKPTDAAS